MSDTINRLADFLEGVADGTVDPEDVQPIADEIAERLPGVIQDLIGDKIDEPDEQEQIRQLAALLRLIGGGGGKAILRLVSAFV